MLAIILIAAASLAVATLIIVYWDEIIDWFRSRNDIKTRDEDNIAFTLKEKMATGQYNVVQGIFNTRTEKVVEGRNIHAKELDEQMTAAHRQQELVIYE